MSVTGAFLGLDYELAAALQDGAIAFFVRERLVKNVQDMVATVFQARSLAGAASKFDGVLNVLEPGVFGWVGAGGLQAIKDRQMQHGQRLISELEASLRVIQAVMATKPKRKLEVWWNPCDRVLAASDAAEDEQCQGSGGFLLDFHECSASHTQ